MFFLGNLFLDLSDHQTKYFSEGVKLRLVDHGLAHLVAELTLHAIDVDAEIDQCFLLNFFQLEIYLDGSNNWSPTFIAILAV